LPCPNAVDQKEQIAASMDWEKPGYLFQLSTIEGAEHLYGGMKGVLAQREATTTEPANSRYWKVSKTGEK